MVFSLKDRLSAKDEGRVRSFIFSLCYLGTFFKDRLQQLRQHENMYYKKAVKYKRPEMESQDKFCEAGFEMPSKDGSISKHRCLSGRAWYQ